MYIYIYYILYVPNLLETQYLGEVGGQGRRCHRSRSVGLTHVRRRQRVVFFCAGTQLGASGFESAVVQQRMSAAGKACQQLGKRVSIPQQLALFVDVDRDVACGC
jgi:hypothetical protein